jgi:hypothetical protein
VRENTAHIRPPRALWVPFDLGRPFGAPNDAPFQLDVLRTVLGLFERTDGPVILDDYPKDAPGQGAPENMEGMVCPIPLPKPVSSGKTDLVQSVLSEAEQLAPWQTLFRETHNRSTVGVCDLGLPDAIRFLGTLLNGEGSLAPPDRDPAITLRFATEDLRNFYLEAAAMRPGGAASTAQLIEWFWGEISAGALILALHPVCTASDNPELQHVAADQMIPRVQRYRLQSQQA